MPVAKTGPLKTLPSMQKVHLLVIVHLDNSSDTRQEVGRVMVVCVAGASQDLITTVHGSTTVLDF
jgi:hypothetical protein